MEKLPMCRICLVQNVRMFVVNNRNLHELYEKLTDIPFVTEDSRPILACFFCCTKLKQCFQLLRKCLEAEEQFAQMMNDDYEPNPIINQDCLEFYSGFIKSPIEHISIVGVCQTESITIKEELPAVCEGPDDIIEPKEEYQSDELEPEQLDNRCLDVADLPPHYSESDLGYDVPLIEFKTELEEEVSKKKQTAREMKRPTVAKKPKPEDAITAEQTKEENADSKVIRPTQIRTSKPGAYNKERSFNQKSHLTNHIGIHTGEKPYRCDVCQRSFNRKTDLKKHFLIHSGEKPYECDVCQRSFRRNYDLRKHIRIHTGEKPYKCNVCQRSFIEKGNLTSHIRIHTGEKPYKCVVCQRSFRQKGILTNHIRIHTGEKPVKKKPYKCDVCQRSFSQNNDLIKHMRIHTGEKPYKCDICERSFNEKSNLTRHIRIHNGEKPCKCNVGVVLIPRLI